MRQKVEESAKKTFSMLMDVAKKEAQRQANPGPMASCSESRTEQLDVDFLGEELGDFVFQDMLFLGEDPPLDAEDRFGDLVQISVLKEGGDPFTRAFLEGITVSCVPFRVRLTNKGMTRYFGEAALQKLEGQDLITALRKQPEVSGENKKD
jgi:hypothetical protein